MGLDQNLFTLNLIQDDKNPAIVTLIEPGGTPHYKKYRIPGNEYKIEVYDPLSESLLITASAPSATSKVKILELHNPSAVIELKYTGMLSFRWTFKWEQHEFEWKREECFMVCKPDPPVLVAITCEPRGRIQTTAVQILDYNLNRFDVEDRKGLEIVILTALLIFQDSSDTYHRPQGAAGAAAPAPPAQTGRGLASTSRTPPPPPLPPPKPAPKTGVDRIAEIQAIMGEINEVTVDDEVGVEDYARYCANLLEDDAMLFISIKSASADQVPKVLQVVEETKRIRHKSGFSAESELHQYVLYDTEKPKVSRRIVLDDNDKSNRYVPPQSLVVHLSKIDMPELRPKATVKGKKHQSGGETNTKGHLKQNKTGPLNPPQKSTLNAGLLNTLHKSTSSSALIARANAPPPTTQSHSKPPSPGSQGKQGRGSPITFTMPQIPNSRTLGVDKNSGRESAASPYDQHHPPSSPKPVASSHSPSSPVPPPNTSHVTQKPSSGVSGLFGSFLKR